MSHYRKKPVVIEARQFLEASATETTAWCSGILQELAASPPKLAIETLEGTMTADVGDWIIQGVKGEFYPCKPDIFEATYEPADGGAGDPVAAERERIAKLADDLKAHYSPSDDGDPSFPFADLIRGRQA